MITISKQLLIAACLAGTVTGSFAQVNPSPTQQPPAPTNLTEEIEVVRPYKPVLADAVKIRRNPDLSDDRAFKGEQTYTIIDKKLELNSNIKELDAQRLSDMPIVIPPANYAKGGVGSSSSALGEIYLGTSRDEALQAGAFFKHLSQQGSLDKQQFSGQEVGVFGRSITEKFHLDGRINYDRRSTFFYGYNPLSSATIDHSRQRLGTISGSASLANNYKEGETLTYDFNANAYHFWNVRDARENTLVLGGAVNKQLEVFNAGLNASADFTAIKDAAYKMGNSILRANPYIKLQANNFLLNIGANLVYEFGDRSRASIFPAVSAELPIVAGYAVLYGGVNGDVLKTSLRDLSLENPYLIDNINIRNSREKMNIYAGVKGNAGAALGYKLGAFYKTVQDLQLFNNNAGLINRFETVYDAGNSKIFGIDGQLNVRASDAFNVSGHLQIFDYELASESAAWFKPAFRLTSVASARIAEKVLLNAELLIQGETSAKLPYAVADPVEKLPGFADLSGAVEYRINPKMGVFFRANNILSRNYQQYLYYARIGLNVIGGLNYSF